jgi:hypothetical protein
VVIIRSNKFMEISWLLRACTKTVQGYNKIVQRESGRLIGESKELSLQVLSRVKLFFYWMQGINQRI